MKIRHFLKAVALLCALSIFLFSLAACGGNSTGENAGATQSGSTEKTADTTVEAFDPMAKYDPPITITTVKRALQSQNFKNGQTLEGDNIWNKLYESYGIKIKYLWVADMSQYDQKLNLSIASGDIPDVFMLNDAQFNLVKKAEMSLDMKEYYDKYASDLTKQYLTNDGGVGLRAGTVDGKMLFLPSANYGSETQGDMLFIRQDWLKNVGLPAPKTIEDMEKVMDAFVHNDPNKDGKGGTFALGIGGKDNLVKDFTSVCGVFSSYHTMPLMYNNGALYFEKDSSGNVIWSGSKPEVKTALSKMQEWFKKGYISPEFGTTDAGGKFVQDLVASKFGMFYGKNWIPYWPIPDLKNKVPSADWIAVPPPTADGQPTVLYGFCPVQLWYAVSKDCKNPEAIIKMLNMWADVEKGPNADVDNYVLGHPEDAGRGDYCNVVKLSDPKDDYNNYHAISSAYKSKDASKLTAKQKTMYDNIMKYMQDPTFTTGWSDYWVQSGVDGSSNKVMFEEMKLQPNVYMSAMTDTMTSKIPTFKKMAEETISQIIYGKAPAEQWDTMVAEWNKLGGDEILKEVQEYAAQSK